MRITDSHLLPWLLLLLMVCVFSVVLGVPGMIRQVMHERETAESRETLRKNAEFLQRVHKVIIKKTGSFDNPTAVRRELDRVFRSSTEQVNKEWKVAKVDGTVYVAQVPESGDQRVCVLHPDGYVEFLKPGSELVLGIMSKGKGGGESD